MPENMLSPSMMCVDFIHLKETLDVFGKCRVPYLHIDIMDGQFVQNIALGTDFCEKLRNATDIPLDIHLMITEPERKLDWFGIRPGEYVSVHWESTAHIQRALARIRELGAKPMIALNPGTPVSVLDYVLDDVDGVLVMTVNPGFAGQKMVPASLNKIADVRRYLDEHGREDADIEVDGNVSFEHSVQMKTAGANIFVGGTSSVFSKQDSLENNIGKTMALIAGRG